MASNGRKTSGVRGKRLALFLGVLAVATLLLTPLGQVEYCGKSTIFQCGYSRFTLKLNQDRRPRPVIDNGGNGRPFKIHWMPVEYGWKSSWTGWRYWNPRPHPWYPQAESHPSPSGGITRSLYVPLWVPSVIALLLAYILHLRNRRPQLRFCTECSYDLTGNESGICPKCGVSIKSGRA